ncbi:MAG: CDP-glycerol glycerophosphotransferase family protein [Candidatus Odinarchaeota archaeon]
MNEIRKIQRLDTLLVQISGSLPKLGDEFPRLYKTWDCFFHISVFVKMVMAWFSLKDKIEILRDSNFWEGIKYREVKIGKLIGEIFVYFTGTRLLSAVKFIEMANWLFRKENVKFVVTPEERTLPNRAICAAASFKNIPTLLIQRGLYGNHCLYRFPLLVDKVALEGEWVKQVLIKMGQDISKLEVTGQPAYDLLKEEYTKIDKTAIRSKFNIDTNNIIVLYTSQPLMEGLGVDNSFIPQDISSSHKEEIREICLSLYDRKDILLLIKPHPNESDDLHYQVVNEVKAKNIKVVSRKANIHELISISDILITRHSTTGLEAIVLDKPVIIVDILGDVDSFPYVDYNSALGVYKRENIWPAVKSIFENKQVNDTLKEGRARFIRDFAYQIDGKSSQRIVALINNMMRRTGGIYAS